MEQDPNIEIQPADKEKIKRIWVVTALLGGFTLIEFIIAFTMSAGGFKTSLFIILTIVKAFYIVGEFMHLSHEVKSLIWTILLPMVFVVWLILALLLQGAAIFEALQF